MTDRLTILPRPISHPLTTGRPAQGRKDALGSFDDLLQSRLSNNSVRFSRHASERLQQRGLDMDAAQTDRLNRAVSLAQSKGGNDALILLDNLAMVVSVKNQTVVTVVEQNRLQENVFTKIDSAVIA